MFLLVVCLYYASSITNYVPEMQTIDYQQQKPLSTQTNVYTTDAISIKWKTPIHTTSLIGYKPEEAATLIERNSFRHKSRNEFFYSNISKGSWPA
jgi:hypothetical protein